MSTLYAHMAELARTGRRFAVATVVRTQGSTPQMVGAKLVLADTDEDTRPAGTLGGGCVEADAIVASREILQRGGRSLRAYELNEDLAWNTGLVCGGTMWILAEPGEEAIAAGGREHLARLAEASLGGLPLVIVTLLERRGQAMTFAARVIVDVEGAVSGSLGDSVLDAMAREEALRQLPHGVARAKAVDDTRDLLIEPIAGRPRIVIAGGGHVAQALARQAMLLDFDATILEDRPEFSDPSRFGGARVLSGDVPSTLASLDYGWSTYLVIATRGHKLDSDCVLAAIRTPVRYIGLLGSRRKIVLVREMLREAGVDESRIAAIHSPVGLDLGGRTPAEIALSVFAEITQVRYQGSGAPLRNGAPA